jgi:hypothetical protein
MAKRCTRESELYSVTERQFPTRFGSEATPSDVVGVGTTVQAPRKRRRRRLARIDPTT